jgi:DNA-binding HxlR family transcriptional regulator
VRGGAAQGGQGGESTQDILKALCTSRADEVLFYLESGEHRYSEIMHGLGINNSNTLCRSLRKLEEFGLVEQADVEVGPAPGTPAGLRYTVYRLTESGADLSSRLRKFRTSKGGRAA